MAERGYVMKLAGRCVKRLDCMKNDLNRDDRPKTKTALENVLRKETSMLLVNSVVNMLYGYKEPVRFKFAEDVFKKEEKLDKEIAEIVFKRCKEEGRTIHILTCDSNLHTHMSSQIKNWYDHRRETFDPDDPVRGIANACSYDYDLNADQMYAELLSAGYIREDGGHVVFQLPMENCMSALEKGLTKWQERIQSELGELTVRSYQKFAQTIIEINADIQGITAEEMGRYCETEFAKRYPMYHPHVDGIQTGGMIQQMSVDDNMDTADNDKTNGKNNHIETMDILEELPTDVEGKFPLDIQPEMAYAIVKLAKMDTPTAPVQSVLNELQSVGRVTYIVSPKYILSSIVDKKITKSFEKSQFAIQLHLGQITKITPTSICKLTDISQFLSFPGKKDIFKKQRKTIERYQSLSETYPDVDYPDSFDIPVEDIRDNVRAFQNYIFKRANDTAQRRRLTLVFNDPEAEARCRETLVKWLAQYTGIEGESELTNETFTEKLIELSFEERYCSSEEIIQKLTELGYLELKGEQVSYTSYYRAKHSEETSNSSEIHTFLGKWNTDPATRDIHGRSSINLLLPPNHKEGRKRKLVMPSGLQKRVNMLKIV